VAKLVSTRTIEVPAGPAIAESWGGEAANQASRRVNSYEEFGSDIKVACSVFFRKILF